MSLISQVCFTRYQVLLYLGQIRNELKHCKILQYYEQDCMIVFFALYTYTCTSKYSSGSKKLVLIRNYQKANLKAS